MPKAAVKQQLKAGMATRRAVLGDGYVDHKERTKSDFDADFQAFITEVAWGRLWSRPGLSKRDRSLITVALLAALGHDEELGLHIKATRNTGASKEEIRETLFHVAVYAGVPAGNRAFRIAKQALGRKVKA